VRIYRSEVTPSAALAAPLVLQRWSAWEDLRGVGRDRRIPAGPGLYRIRRANGEPELDYVGQTGRSLRERLGQLGGVYHAQMPYHDPRTAAPALWALRHRDGCDFEAAVIEVPGTIPQRKALEATAITLYRLDSGRSPAASSGRIPAGYKISSGNNARLAAAGRRYRGCPDPAAPADAASVPVNGLPGADPASADWMGWEWSPWAPISRARGSAAGTGLYRVRSSSHADSRTSAREPSRDGSEHTQPKPRSRVVCQYSVTAVDLRCLTQPTSPCRDRADRTNRPW
jgi:hypothetical protein